MSPRRSTTNNKDGSIPSTSPNHRECKECNAGSKSLTFDTKEAEFRLQRLFNENTSSSISQANNNNDNTTTNRIGFAPTGHNNTRTTFTSMEDNKDHEMDNETIDSNSEIDPDLYSILQLLGHASSNNKNSNNNNGSNDDDNQSLSFPVHVVSDVEIAFQKETLQDQQTRKEYNTASINSAANITTLSPQEKNDLAPVPPKTRTLPFISIPDFSPTEIWETVELILTLLLLWGLILLFSIFKHLVGYASPNNSNNGSNEKDQNLFSYNDMSVSGVEIAFPNEFLQGFGQGIGAAPPAWEVTCTILTTLMCPAGFGTNYNLQTFPQTQDERTHWQGTQQDYHDWVACQSVDKQRAQCLLHQLFNTSWDMWAFWIGINMHFWLDTLNTNHHNNY